MLKKSIIFLSVFLPILSFSNDGMDFDLKWDGVTINFQGSADNEKKQYIIKRIHNEECRKINGADPKVIWSGNYAKSDISDNCKKTFVTTVGKITPMKISDKVKTIGELEVIDFIKKSQTNTNMLLIDARLPEWYNKKTIPTAENIPFTYFNPKKYPDDFYDVLETIGVIVNKDGSFDFSKAKELVLFCNGIWCPQSTFAIENLIKLGYPEEKISWYRGGMYSWTMLNLTTSDNN